jgi:hypothetical protein
MPDTETEITARFPVEGDRGSSGTVIQQSTFLRHRAGGHKAEIQIDWYLNGESLIRDQTDHNVFTNPLTKETFRRVR